MVNARLRKFPPDWRHHAPCPHSKYGELLRHTGEAPVAVRRCETVEEVLREADVSFCGRG